MPKRAQSLYKCRACGAMERFDLDINVTVGRGHRLIELGTEVDQMATHRCFPSSVRSRVVTVGVCDLIAVRFFPEDLPGDAPPEEARS